MYVKTRVCVVFGLCLLLVHVYAAAAAAASSFGSHKTWAVWWWWCHAPAPIKTKIKLAFTGFDVQVVAADGCWANTEH